MGEWLEVCLLRGLGKGNELSGGTGLLHRRVGHHTEGREGESEGNGEKGVERSGRIARRYRKWREGIEEEGVKEKERQGGEGSVEKRECRDWKKWRVKEGDGERESYEPVVYIIWKELQGKEG